MMPIDTLQRFLSVSLWWIIKIVCGITALFGAIVVGWNSVELFYLATGKVTVFLDPPPPVPTLVSLLAVGILMLVGGYKIPKWLDIDRLL